MKRFFENTLISGAYSKALRVVALLCVLLGVSTSAWSAKVYFDNGPTNWANVHVYVRNQSMWNGDNGVSTKGATYYSMTRVGTSNIWECNVTVAFTHICFMKDRQDNYGNIWQTEAAYYEGYTEAKPLLTPKDNNENRNQTKYYNGGSWSAYSGGDDSGDVTTTDCYLTGTFNNWNYTDPNYKMEQNPGNPTESMIKGVSLSANAEIMVYMGTTYYGYKNATINQETSGMVENAGGDYENVKVLKAGTYDIYFDRENKIIYIGNHNAGGDDSGELGECDKVEIYCHYDDSSDHNMTLHIWSSGGSAITTWPGVQGTQVTVDGVKYAKWEYPTGSTNLCVQFISSTDTNYKTESKCGLSKGNKYYFSLPKGWGGNSYDPTKTESLGCSGDDDDDDDETAEFDCNTIEIWCKGVGSYIDMACYAWDPDNLNNQPLGGWWGSTRHDIGSYQGSNYAVWRVSGYDKLSIIFNNQGGDTKTADIFGLTKGHRYIYSLEDKWGNTTPSPTVVTCSGEDIGEQTAGTIFLDLSSFQDWTKEGALFKAEVTQGDGTKVTYDFTQCSTETDIYFIDQVLNLNDITKVNVLRIDPNNLANTWNQTETFNFKPATPCVKISGWNKSYSLTTYSGSCGVTSQGIVYISKDAKLSDDKSTVTMYGFLGYTLCASITEYGFIYTQCTSGVGNCIPTKNSAQLKVQGSAIERGDSFELTTSGLPAGFTYGYKAYVKIEDFIYVSDETGYFTLADCESRPVKGSPITYTIDASLGKGHIDECTLTYGDLETALKALKNSYTNTDNDGAYQYVTHVDKDGVYSYDLNQDVTFLVHFYDNTESTETAYTYQGTDKVASAGTDKIEGGKGLALLIENFNRSADAAYTLTIKAANMNAKPWIHHPIIRKSRNITLDGLFLVSDPAGKIKDNAFEIDVNSQGWKDIGIGEFKNANILVQNCMIGSAGFTGVHISGYDGVTFIDNAFEAVFTSGTTNDINYGASAKFMACKNVKFMRNDFRGDHATLVWMQECQNVLFMNNVFWNTNKWLSTSQTPAAIRLVAQFGKDLQDLGFYYNTFYFANTDHGTDNESSSGYDFLAFSNTVNNSGGSSSDFISGKIDFMYNNCYSYDDDAPGKSSNPLLSRKASDFNFCPNNFWSVYDEALYVAQGKPADYKSKFDFTGCADFINVQANVCETTATGPASLVVSGTGLNIGSRPDISKTGITLTEDEMRRDRTRENARPENGSQDKWTVGAYQNSESIKTKTIIWQGITSDKWDDRNNWIDAETGNRLTCLNELDPELEVIIPQANSRLYPTPAQGVAYWPVIPEDFDDAASRREQSKVKPDDLGVPEKEQVNAGNSGMYAKTIELEYGAAIKGVENLKNGSTHYTSAKIGFTATRAHWILVGTVVKPWDEKIEDNRNIVSGDYFIPNHEPHVYMHMAKIDGTNAKWDETFADLNIEVSPTTVFAIQLPDQYGKYKLPAQYYTGAGGKKFDPTEPYSYSFVGKFVNEASMPEYTVEASTPVLLNNSYPCNIDAKALEEISGGDVQYYDYTSGTFLNTESTTSQVLLKPQHGFIFTPAAGKTSLTITKEMLTGGDAKSRSAKVELPTFSLNLYNANTGVGYSNIVTKIDDLLADGEEAVSNVEKVFAPNADSPELYIVANDAMYSRYTVGSNTQVIPLGVRLKKDMNIKFKKEYAKDYDRVILVDTYTGKEIDLLRNSYTTEALVAGDIEGRFFLNLNLATDVEDEENGDDNVSTEVEDNEIINTAINIFTDEANMIRVVTNGVELKTIYVSDMAGKTMKYDVKGYAATLNLPVAQGVYTVSVIGDIASRTEKVILK